MKLVYSWLKEFVDFDWTPEEMADKLTLSGLEVEGIEKVGKTFNGVLIGKVISRVKHPNADKLSVCQVDYGNGPMQIVCGAPNVEAGQTVPVAVVGAILPENFEIKKAKIRGEESNGMICSKSELGFEEGKSDGIWILDSSLTAGTDFAEHMQLKEDYVFEIGITANRGDCLSHLGVAREISALTGNPVRLPDISLDPKRLSDKSTSDYIKLVLDDSDGCPVYTGWYIDNVQTSESPNWLKNRLIWLGLRPRNVLVDVTNYVLHELGQPLHAFDYDRLESKTIRVKSFDKLKFTTLDSKQREMPDQSLMICDGENPVAVAGIMGGENSEIVESTKSVLLESAYFNPSRVRKTAKRLGLSTDASYRFERGVDPKLNLFAAQRAIKLFLDLTGGVAAKVHTDVTGKAISKKELRLRLPQIKRIIGIEIPKDTVTSILKMLGFELIGEGNDELSVRVPTHRHDIEREIDIIEELIRIYGLEHVKEATGNYVSLNPEIPSFYKEENALRTILNGAGYSEIICNSMIPENRAKLFCESSVKILNPQSEDMSFLRPSLIPGMLDIIRHNNNYAIKNMKVFELGNCFELSADKGHYSKVEKFLEEQYFAVAMTGLTNQASWNVAERASSLFDLKGLIVSILDRIFSLPSVSFKISESKQYSDCLTIYSHDTEIGFAGSVHSSILNQFDIKQPVYAAELNLDKIRSLKRTEKRYKELSKFVPVEKDMAFILSKSIAADELLTVIKSTNNNFIRRVHIFDLYEGKNMEPGMRSIGFRMTLLNEEKTFTDSDIEQIMQSVNATLTKKYNAKLRGN